MISVPVTYNWARKCTSPLILNLNVNRYFRTQVYLIGIFSVVTKTKSITHEEFLPNFPSLPPSH